MAIQRAGGSGAPNLPGTVLAPAMPQVSSGPALSTRESPDKPFIELGVMFGQALGGREPVMQALTNLQNIGQTNGCDAVIAVRLLHYPTAAGPAVVAYGTGIRFLPQAPEPADGGASEPSGVTAGAGVTGAAAGSSAAGAAGGPPAGGPAGAPAAGSGQTA